MDDDRFAHDPDAHDRHENDWCAYDWKVPDELDE